jgi:hypothetical protein
VEKKWNNSWLILTGVSSDQLLDVKVQKLYRVTIMLVSLTLHTSVKNGGPKIPKLILSSGVSSDQLLHAKVQKLYRATIMISFISPTLL